jgi:ADP-ribose pyrophosphatase
MMEAPFPLFDLNAEAHWQHMGSTFVDAGPHVQVEHAKFLTPTRFAPVPWTIVNRKAAVAIAPMLEDGRLVLIAQERIPVRHTMWEFPAGQIDVPYDQVTHQDVIDTALNELREETGCVLAEDGTLEPLGWYFPSAGFTQEIVYLFLAKTVRIAHEPRPAGMEQINGICKVTLRELLAMIDANEGTDCVCQAIAA